MFLEEFCEGWHRNIEGVIAIVLMDSIQFGFRGYSLRFLEMLEEGFRIGVDRVGQRFEGIRLGIVKKSAFLE
jgi:hypothetical protein